MAGKLAYSAEELGALGTSLKTLADLLSRGDVLQPADLGDVGAEEVVHALDQFAALWRTDHRNLAESLRALGEHALQAADSLTSADRSLAADAPKTAAAGK